MSGLAGVKPPGEVANTVTDSGGEEKGGVAEVSVFGCLAVDDCRSVNVHRLLCVGAAKADKQATIISLNPNGQLEKRSWGECQSRRGPQEQKQ